jgi:chromosomal replication initiation ATPase DnaA
VVLAVGPELPSVASIQKAVADRFGIGMSALLGAGTAKHLVAARYEAIRQAHAARPDLSSLTLGRLFRRDHSIILRVIKSSGRV